VDAEESQPFHQSPLEIEVSVEQAPVSPHFEDPPTPKPNDKNLLHCCLDLNKLTFFLWVTRLIPILAACAALYLIIKICSSDSAWETDPNSSDDDKLSREKARGQLVSVALSVLLNIVAAFMFYIKVKEGLVVINYGFILQPVFGFLCDQGIATDAGLSLLKTFPDGVSFTFSSLVGANFGRYIVTVLLDMFISNPLQDVLKRQLKQMGVIKALLETNGKGRFGEWYDQKVAENIPSILQSIVAVATFNAYTNETRFAWAYPSDTLDRDLRIPPGTIMLATCIAGVLYLNFYTIMDIISDREYYDVNTKLTYVMLTIALLCGLSMTDSMEAPVAGEEISSMTESFADLKPAMGGALFMCFVAYGFVYPMVTVLSCLKSGTDHITDHPEPEPDLERRIAMAAKWSQSQCIVPNMQIETSHQVNTPLSKGFDTFRHACDHMPVMHSAVRTCE